ncbi:MAG: zinc ribbon domain-containing protein [Bacilli bacterium]|nr:zinc ribbon domain-containing protein [Bacilli bacterium]
MSFEGTGKYFLSLFIVYLIIILITDISLSKIFKNAKVPSWKAYIPIYKKYILVKILDLKISVFYMTFIPFANLYYYNVIIQRLLEVLKVNDNSIMFLLVPLYKFPELAIKNPPFELHLYDETEQFIHNENSLFENEQGINNQTIASSGIVVNPAIYNQTGENNESKYNETVFSNSNLEPDTRKETIIEAKPEVKQDVNPITVNNLKPKVCPKCGTKLEPTAKTCFFCGTNV